jgi:hypothetical protein
MDAWRALLWRQYGATLDVLENAIVACPEALWDDGSEPPGLFWYGAYHPIFYVDCYLSEKEEGFAPPPPFDLSEYDPSGRLPPRTYTKRELLDYLGHCRRKLRARIEGLTEADLTRGCPFARRDLSVVELLVYTLRHVQHHAAQLNMLLRQKGGLGSPWVSVAKEPWASPAPARSAARR